MTARHPEKVNNPTNPIKKKPSWIRTRILDSQNYFKTKEIINTKKLHTVCQEANCPNISECWSKRHATFMIMGDTCTRACSFCNVKTGKPTFLDSLEPLKIAQATKELNLKVKFRESFRPFAPSILIEDVSDWFDLKKESPYMLLVADLKKELQIQMSKEDQTLFGIDKLNIKRSSIPAVTHVDYSARIQTVHKETNPRYHNLLKKFKEITGCPVLVNTSFNVRGEPIVCSIKDAFNCFMGTNLDILVCENFILYKNDQDDSLKKNYQMEFDPD